MTPPLPERAKCRDGRLDFVGVVHVPRRELNTKCDVVIHLKGGGTVSGRCEIMKGEPGNPHRPEDVEKKFFDLTVPVWGAQRAKSLYAALLGLENVADLRAFGARFAL